MSDPKNEQVPNEHQTIWLSTKVESFLELPIRQCRNTKYSPQNYLFEIVELFSGQDSRIVRTSLILCNEFGYTEDYSECSNIKAKGIEDRFFKVTRIAGRIKRSIEDFWAELQRSHPEMVELFEHENNWLASKEVVPTENGITYFLDNRAIWPAWTFIAGSDPELLRQVEKKNTTISSDDDPLIGVAESVLGIGRNVLASNVPWKVIGVRQDIVRIDRNRLFSVGTEEESVLLTFKIGKSAGALAFQEGVRLTYTLYNKDGKVISSGAKTLTGESLRIATLLGVQDIEREKEIARADIFVFVGETLVDWSSAWYVRHINVNLNIKTA